jgi:hypothetical protein
MKTRALFVLLALVAVACENIPSPTAFTPASAISDGALSLPQSGEGWLELDRTGPWL